MAKVLVVDDSPTMRAMIVETMTSIGLEVTEAGDGVDGQEKMAKFTPDIIILDVVMPRMNGYEFCRWVKSESTSQNIPVIMCSTKAEAFDIHWGKKQGVDAYITKPFDPQDLINKVKELLHH